MYKHTTKITQKANSSVLKLSNLLSQRGEVLSWYRCSFLVVNLSLYFLTLSAHLLINIQLCFVSLSHPIHACVWFFLHLHLHSSARGICPQAGCKHSWHSCSYLSLHFHFESLGSVEEDYFRFSISLISVCKELQLHLQEFFVRFTICFLRGKVVDDRQKRILVFNWYSEKYFCYLSYTMFRTLQYKAFCLAIIYGVLLVVADTQG